MSACARFHRGGTGAPQQRPLPGLRPILGPALVRKLRREAVSRVGSWLNYATIHVRPRARPGVPLDCAAWSAALPAWREVEAQMCEAARRFGCGPLEIAPPVRRLYRRHCADGRVGRVRARARAAPVRPRGPADAAAAGAVRPPRSACRGAAPARRCRCSVRTAQGASERLARLRQWGTGRLSAGQFVQRASLVRVPDSQIRSTQNVCTPPGGRLRAGARRERPAASVSSSPGTFGMGWLWAGRATGPAAGGRAAGRAVGPCAATSDRVRAAVPVPRTPSRSGRAGGCSQVGRGPSSSRLQRAHRLGRWCCGLGAVAASGAGLRIASAPGPCQRLRRPPLRSGPTADIRLYRTRFLGHTFALRGMA